MRCCKDCKHFQDANYSRTYISPICLAHGGDDAAFMRRYICGIEDARLYEPKPDARLDAGFFTPETQAGTETEDGRR